MNNHQKRILKFTSTTFGECIIVRLQKHQNEFHISAIAYWKSQNNYCFFKENSTELENKNKSTEFESKENLQFWCHLSKYGNRHKCIRKRLNSRSTVLFFKTQDTSALDSMSKEKATMYVPLKSNYRTTVFLNDRL